MPHASATNLTRATVVAPQVGGASGASELPTVEGYELTAELGRGAMGVVYAARDLRLGREVAVKVMRAGHSAAAFARETRITARLQHPAIPPVHATGELADGSPFLAMKLIRGETLDSILRARANPTDHRPRLLATFERVCHAVGYAHARGVIHRDLKPGNVMVGAFDDVQVMDWGLAKEVRGPERDARGAGSEPLSPAPSSETYDGSAKGTPTYMAPEQARGEWEGVGPPSDVFALGGVLCAILTGKPPFAGASAYEALDRAKRADLSDALARLDASGAAPELLALCKTCLAVRPEDRYADGTAVAHAVAAYRAGVDERAQRAERDRAAAEARAAEEANTRREAEARADAERAARVEQRKRARARLLLAGAAALLAAAGALFVWWSGVRKANEATLAGAKNAAEARAAAEAAFKERQARQGIDASLNLAVELRRGYKFKQAEAALAQAAELASGAPERTPEVARARRDLAFVEALDRIRFLKWAWIAETGNGGDFNTKVAPPEYRAAFAKFDLDLTALVPEAASAQIAASAVKAEIVAAVDDWALYEPDTGTRERLLDVARRADPGEWLDRLRDPNARATPIAVARLSAEADVRNATPGALRTVAELMRRCRLDPAPLLTAACDAHPSDFELAFARGQCRASSTNGEQIGAYEAARALRPDNPTVWLNLGAALCEKGDTDGGLAAYRKACALAPDLSLVHSNLGTALFRKGDTTGAVAAFRRAIELDRSDAQAHSDLGVALHSAGDTAGAIAACRKAIELAPEYGTAHYNLGVSLTQMGDTAGAIAAYQRAGELSPRDAKVRSNLGVVLQAKGDMAGALAAHRKACALDPSDARAHYNLGVILGDTGDRAGAITAYRKAIELNSKLGGAHYNLGNALRAGGDLDGAVAAYRNAVELEPADAKAHSNLGSALHAKRDVTGALAACRKACELAPRDATVFDTLGTVLGDKGDTTGAVAAFRRAVELNPEFARAHYNLGIALRDAGDLDGAIAAHRKAIALAPKDARAHYDLGTELRGKGDTAGAITAYRRAVELDPTDVKAHTNLGNALLATGDAGAAVAAHRKACAVAPRDALAQFNLGVALLATGDADGAIVAYRKACELDPKLAKAHSNLGASLDRKGNWDEAVVAYKRAIELEPKDAPTHTNLGVTYLKLKRPADAAACARAAITADPRFSNAHALLGFILQQQGDIPGARAALTEAARLDKKWAGRLSQLPPLDVAPVPRAK